MEHSRSNHPQIQNLLQQKPQVGLEAHKSSQPTHSSPYHVHPYPPPVPPQQAYQSQTDTMFHPKGLKPCQETRELPIVGRALCLTPKDSPGPGRVSHLSDKFQDSLTMFSDTDELVARISAMFPTVSHTHIRILLKKYYNREAVVISALQVEKHPIATPGPLTMSPSNARLGSSENNTGTLPAIDFPGPSQGYNRNAPNIGAQQNSPPVRVMTPSYIQGMRQRQADSQSTRHSSPKMKLNNKKCEKYIRNLRNGYWSWVQMRGQNRNLFSALTRYLKNVYPKADETFILEVLANNENSVYMAGQDLEAMGYDKKELQQEKNKEQTPQPVKKVVLTRTLEDRNQLFAKLQRKYWSVPQRLIQFALESVEYNEERADYILKMLLQERTSPMLNPQEAQQTRRASVLDLPSAAWFPNEDRVASLPETPPTEPVHAPALAAPQVAALPFVPAYVPGNVPVPPYAPMPAFAPAVLPAHVPMFAPPHVQAHMAANASAHMAAYAHQQVHLPAHVFAYGHPQVPMFPPAFVPAFALQTHAHAMAQVHAQAFAHARAQAHAQAQAAAVVPPPPPPPAPAPAPPAPHDARRQKQWNEQTKPNVKTNSQGEANTYQSQYHNAASGPNPSMRQGPQDNLLLEDYMPWNGPNPELRRSQPTRQEGREQQPTQCSLARGPSGLAQGPSGLARGPSGQAQGPAGRARGSMYRNRHHSKK